MTDLPAPLVSREVDLRNFPDLPIDVARLRDSDLRRRSSGDEFKAAMLLWFAAWHQVPAGSLPDDDIELADFAGMGTGKPAVRAFLRIKEMALRGWIRCAGFTEKDPPRLYHPKMAEKANMAWRAKLAQRDRTLKARIASLTKAIQQETSPAKRAVLQGELDRLLQDVSGGLPHPQPQTPVTGVPTGSKGSEGIGSDRSGGSAHGAPDPTPPPASPSADPQPGSHLVETLDALGLPSHHPEALAQWVALLTGPLVRAADEDEQRQALTWMVRKALKAGNGERVQFAKHAQPFAGMWCELRAKMRTQPPEPRAAEKSTAEIAAQHRARRLRGELADWEKHAIAGGKSHVGIDGSLLPGPAPVPVETTP